MKQEDFNYKAFISYRHTDGKPWAKWLKYHLDTFRSNKDSDEKYPLKEVFLDNNNLGLVDVERGGLSDNLRQSKYLICICTKDYKRSYYAQREREEFEAICSERGVNWRDYTIPVVVGGNLDYLPDDIKSINAAFLPERKPVFFSLKALKGLSFIAAKMLDIDNPDSIFNYLKWKDRFKYTLLISISLLLLAGCLAFWDARRTKCRYYKDITIGRYVEGNTTDWIYGIDQIKPSEAKRSLASYRLEYRRASFLHRRWLLRRVVCQNAKGIPTVDAISLSPIVKYPITDIHYREADGQFIPERIEFKNRHGHLQSVHFISGRHLDEIDIKNSNYEVMTYNTYPETISDIDIKNSNITHFHLKRDPFGNVNEIDFHQSGNISEGMMLDRFSHVCIMLDYDNDGRVIAAKYYNCDGKADYWMTYYYGLSGTSISYFDDGKRFLTVKLEHDPSIRTLKEYRIFPQKKLTLITLKYDQDFLITEVNNSYYTYKDGKYVDESESVTLHNEKPLTEKLKYDASGNLILSEKEYINNIIEEIRYESHSDNCQIRFFDKTTRKQVNIGDSIREIYKYYDHDQLSSVHVLRTSGNYSIQFIYDEDKKLIETHFTDDAGRMSSGNYSIVDPVDRAEKSGLTNLEILLEMKKNNHVLFKGDSIFFLGRLFPLPDKFSKRKIHYDLIGNICSIEYFDINGTRFAEVKEKTEITGAAPESALFIYNSKGQRFCIPLTFTPKLNSGETFEAFADELLKKIEKANQKLEK